MWLVNAKGDGWPDTRRGDNNRVDRLLGNWGWGLGWLAGWLALGKHGAITIATISPPPYQSLAYQTWY